MAKISLTQIIRSSAYLISALTLLYGCASPQQIQGGPRDTTPPKVLKMSPENLSTNFKAEKIVIQFDEYFKIQNQVKEFSISPDLAIAPTLKVKQKSLEITFQDTLEKNTTYTLNFGNSIADINESNPVKNFTYVFSTGPKLDSLSIKGRVINSITGLPELDAVALIIPLNRDTIFGKYKPSIYTTTDSSGNFSLNNLREDTYKIYAIKEKNGDRIYQQATDEVGFIKDSIVLKRNVDSLVLNIFKENASNFRILDRRLNTDGSISFAFNQKLKRPEVNISDPAALDAGKKIRFSKNNDSLKIWLTDLSFDSTKIVLKDEGKLLQTTTITRGKKETYSRSVNPTFSLENRLLNPYKPLKIYFNLPIENIDISKITLLEDSVERKNFTVKKDSLDFLSYVFVYPWKAKRIYDIKLGAEAVSAIFNTKNKEVNTSFELANKDDYGTLNVKVITPEKDKSYILEVVNELKNVINKIVVRQDTSVSFTKYKAGIYFIRIVYDTNKNGSWDTGNIAEKLQPERIWYEPKELSIRANWDRNDVITIPKE
ncbi:Ig-like domain-containing protein [Pedobacter metabolipauper]|uniref:Ig-like domain-containing protein n=1 Tax=Pedobacter metabolipauper TaxID=425513 RepID=A0A4R6SW15_9SPHI|nr:Ig-like domain-containing protein [Pedobacter metabolipauper]TDQ09566.1 Ig-like domain-containing protein [Pedobacter metabolipauper]